MFSYDAKPPCNLASMPIEVLRAQRMFKENALERINMATISKLAEAPEATVVYVLKQIVSAVESTSE